jgi:sugar lactone lactonase YvrE
VTVVGDGFDVSGPALPDVRIGDVPARAVAARATRLSVTVPPGLPGGVLPLTVAGADGNAPLQVGRAIAEGLHQVDSPAFDAQGRLYVTYSGSRGQQVPVSVFRITRDGPRESLVTGLVNPTALAVGPDGHLYVSSRFEGVVYKVDDSGHYETAVSDVGIACGLAFTPDGSLLVGDRSGTIFRVLANGKAVMLASLPASVAAFHLAMGPDGNLYVTAPTLTARDHVYRVSLDGKVEIAWSVFGRPQGLAFGPDDALFVVEALAGASGLYRVELESAAPPQLVLSGAGLVGVAFDPLGGVVVASNDTAWRLEGLQIDD